MFLDNEHVQHFYQEFLKEKRAMNFRLKQDLVDLDLSDEIQLNIPDSSDITTFTITVIPDQESVWASIPVQFLVQVPHTYPYKAPRVACLTPPFHPNISYDGKVCLNIIREDWKPVYTLNHVVQGLVSLFYYPVTTDPLNQEAAELFLASRSEFVKKVQAEVRNSQSN